MVRTKQRTARKSTAGKAPRKQLAAKAACHRWIHILGDPGDTSRDDPDEPLFQEVVEFRPAGWGEKYFSAQSARTSSRVTLSPFYTK